LMWTFILSSPLAPMVKRLNFPISDSPIKQSQNYV
jgi:hypothetical protein